MLDDKKFKKDSKHTGRKLEKRFLMIFNEHKIFNTDNIADGIRFFYNNKDYGFGLVIDLKTNKVYCLENLVRDSGMSIPFINEEV